MTVILEDSPSPNWKVHLNLGVPPVKVAVNVDSCPTERWALDAVKLVRTRAGTEKVYVRLAPGEIERTLVT